MPTDRGQQAAKPRYTNFRERRDPPAMLCCEVWWAPWPSGHAWSHSDRCRAGIGVRSQKVELPRDEPWVDLPSAGSRDRTWLAHPPGHRCDDCQYVEAHLDDDDDDGSPWPAILEKEDPNERRAD